MTGLAGLATPCALVELERVERNTERMAERAHALGVRLRPHVKTHKTAELARLQVRGHFGGVTVSTVAEARAMAAAGLRDITYAVPLAPELLGRLAELARGLERLSLLIDHPDAASWIEERARADGRPIPVYLKLDCGAGRAGVDPERGESLRLAARLARSPHVEFRGLLTHAGQAYRCRTRDAIRAEADRERDVPLRFARRLREDGVEVPDISIGSTPTAMVAADLAGIGEIRPGNYVFFDAFQAAIGSCSLDECAFTVLATVIGRHPERNTLVINAGALALSKDAGPTHVDPACGFGRVFSEDGTRLFDGLRVESLTQEHGLVRSRGPLGAAHPLGSRLRIIPNHSCLAAAQHDRYHVVRGNEIVAEWRPARGW
ncbi:MAG: alanine racemase [Acidobacteria bacterium]|nr:alanine racemase [Acidobacteriota bacterium]